MGSSGSKAAYCGSSSSSSESVSGSARKRKSKGSRVFQSSCLGSRRHDDTIPHVCNRGNKQNEGNASSTNQAEMESSHRIKSECYEKLKFQPSDAIPSPGELHEWNEASIANTTSTTGSTSAPPASTHSLTSPARFLSRFFIPGNASFRLSRATSLGSSRSYPVPSTSLRMFNDDDDIGGDPRSSSGVVNRKRTQQTTNSSATSLFNRSPVQCHEGSSASLHLHSTSSDFLGNDLHDNQTTLPIHNSAQDSTTRVGFQGNSCSPRMFDDADNIETRLPDRRTGAREPVDRNVLFSRTLSVGRLRDRVLRRSSLSDLTFCPLEQGRDSSQVSGRRALDGDIRVSEPEGTNLTSPSSSAYSSSAMPGIQDHEVETSRSREARYHDLLEHRSNFLERRRRIRSQVRALQRLGSRFENLSGHERSCILSGQHRTGRCTCRASNRDPNLNDDSSARASISRIVMLAEALFEVLDEIHQQSVVLSSQPSVSSLGSVPAPIEVVESLPVKSYTKSQKHQTEETAQCYICLVEYEEGDSMRILPCHHDFHRTCIDKWLKEIHRVCPLCRGDICRADSLPNEN